MKFNSILSVLGLASVLMFISCTDEVDYTPAPVVETPGVYFSAEEEVNFTIDSENMAQNIILSRQKTDGELTVTLTTSGDTDKFSVPGSVTFANGAVTTLIPITALTGAMEDFSTYKLTLTIEDALTSPYINNMWEGSFYYAMGEEWPTIGKCVFTDDALGPLFSNPCFTWEVEIQEHALTPGLYRLVNPYGCSASPFSKYSVETENYIVVNATNPAKVYLGDNPNNKVSTGINMGYGVMSLALQAYGTLANGKITWPVKGLAVFDDDGGYLANNSGEFCIDLTSLE